MERNKIVEKCILENIKRNTLKNKDENLFINDILFSVRGVSASVADDSLHHLIKDGKVKRIVIDMVHFSYIKD